MLEIGILIFIIHSIYLLICGLMNVEFYTVRRKEWQKKTRD